MAGRDDTGGLNATADSEPEPFRNIRLLRNHWSRPIGPLAYYWYLTFATAPGLHALAAECQRPIAFPYYDLIPPSGLHLTLDRIGFEGAITSAQLNAIEAAARHACRVIRPFTITVGMLGGRAARSASASRRPGRCASCVTRSALPRCRPALMRP